MAVIVTAKGSKLFIVQESSLRASKLNQTLNAISSNKELIYRPIPSWTLLAYLREGVNYQVDWGVS